MKRKFISLLICLSLLTYAFCIPICAETSIEPITMSEAIPVEGRESVFDVPIYLDITRAVAIDLNIRLNPNLVSAAEMVNLADCLDNTMYSSNQTGDKFKVAIASGEAISYSGVLFYLRLTLKAQPTDIDELCRLLQVKINEKITWQADNRVLITGVTDGASYKDNVTVTFNEGSATLNGEPFFSGDTVAPNGEYTLIITDLGGTSRTVNFIIDRTVISVDVEWSAMSFTYSEGNWNNSTHEFDGQGWKADENSGSISVTNNSNVPVQAKFDYNSNEGFEKILLDFVYDGAPINVKRLEVSERLMVDARLSGAPNEKFENVEIGNITISICKIVED